MRRSRSLTRKLSRATLTLTARQLAKLDGLARRNHVNRSLLAGLLIDGTDASWRPAAPAPKRPRNCGRPHPQPYCLCMACESARLDATSPGVR